MFQDSAIVDFDSHLIREAASRFPSDLFPSFVGSARLGVGLDSSGLQGHPTSVSQMRGKDAVLGNGRMDELYVFGDGQMSEHLFWDEIEGTDPDALPPDARLVAEGRADEIDAEGTLEHTFKHHREHLMPLGYLDYTITVDGTRISASDLDEHVRGEWTRETDLEQGIVTTTAIVADAVKLRLGVFVPQKTYRIYLQIDIESYDGDRHEVTIEPELVLETRGGLPIYDEAGAIARRDPILRASIGEDSRYAPMDSYSVLYGAATREGTTSTEDGIAVKWSGEVEETPERCDLMFVARPVGDDDAEKVERACIEAMASLDREGLEPVKERHVADWAGFWDHAADLRAPEAPPWLRAETYLLHCSEYLHRCGHRFATGASTCFHLHHQPLFHGATWWDFHFMVDGVLHANMLEEGRSSVDWLADVIEPEGRPYSYMLAYDGRPLIDDHREIVEFQVAAHATSAWKLYEATGDRTLLREDVYPLVRRCANYLATLFEETEDGLRLQPLGHDAGEHTTVVADRTFHAAWFLATMRRAAHYARTLGIDAAEREDWDELVERYEFPGDEDAYYFAAGVAPEEFEDEPPYFTSRLLYPTEATEIVDIERFRRTRDRAPPIQLNKPWMSYAQAATDYRAGDVERAADHYAEGRNLTFGMGYFKEIGPFGAAGNIVPPFATAHGAHLTALLEQFAMARVEDETLLLGVNLASEFRDHRLEFDRVRTYVAVSVSGSIGPEHVQYTIENQAGTRSLSVVIRPPTEATPRTARVSVDGERVTPSESDGLIELDVDVPENGEVNIVVERSTSA